MKKPKPNVGLAIGLLVGLMEVWLWDECDVWRRFSGAMASREGREKRKGGPKWAMWLPS